MNFKETSFGYEYQTDKHLIFFGKKTADLNFLKKNYPQFEFRFIRQTHSDIYIKSVGNSSDIEADAHGTEEKNKALVIRTADCIPCLIINNETQDILAIHAGWKGVENQIIKKTLKHLAWTNISVFWGPHILQSSFEVDEPVKDLLLKSGYHLSTDVCRIKDNKYFVSLLQIAQSQVYQCATAKEYFCLVNTKTMLDFYSYRREKNSTGRNLSFIVKI